MDPKLQIEKRLDNLELAVSTMAHWLSQTPDSFGQKDVEGIEKILRGERLKEPKGEEDDRRESSDNNSDPE